MKNIDPTESHRHWLRSALLNQNPLPLLILLPPLPIGDHLASLVTYTEHFGSPWGNFWATLGHHWHNICLTTLRQHWNKFEKTLGPHGDFLVTIDRAEYGHILPFPQTKWCNNFINNPCVFQPVRLFIHCFQGNQILFCSSQSHSCCLLLIGAQSTWRTCWNNNQDKRLCQILSKGVSQ